MAAGAQELPAPPEARGAARATEVLRAWIVDGGLQVSLRPGFDDPAVWGILLADVARHAARAFAAEGHDERKALAAIRAMLKAEWKRPTDLGRTSAVQ